MQIPRKFKLGRKKFSVHIVKRLPTGVRGRVYPDISCIQLSMQHSNNATETFWHEVTHAILHDMDAYIKWDNEPFVKAFSKRLAQVVETAEL